MKILEEKIPKSSLPSAKNFLGGEMVKAVVDINRQLLALDAEMHADLEKLFLENGSNQYDLWGINLYPDETGEDFIEFNSMINIRPAQGNRSRGVEDAKLQQKIRDIVAKWIA